MKSAPVLALVAAVFTLLACSLNSPQTEPAAAPSPESSVSMPTPFDLSSIPTQTVAAPAAAGSFSGTWKGPDPDDGSTMILTLLQSGSTLEGRYSDSYSPNVVPPGYDGTLAGSVLSPTTATMTLQLSRHDGQNLLLQANITLSDQNTIQVTITSQSGVGLWVLTRQ